MTTGRFPDSDIPGSMPVYDSPGLFAVHHVLPRLKAPRHPPYALASLDSVLSCLRVSPRAWTTLPPPNHAGPSGIDGSLVLLFAGFHSVKERCGHPSAAHGDERIRTAALLLARQALSHLSYAPSKE
jgi:hypothetical protein